jgi:hypothetical protein
VRAAVVRGIAGSRTTALFRRPAARGILARMASEERRDRPDKHARYERVAVYGSLLVGVLAAVASIVSAGVANIAISEAREERDDDRRDLCLEAVLAAASDRALTEDRWAQGVRDRDRDIAGLALHSDVFIRCRTFVSSDSELWNEVSEAANAYGALTGLDAQQPPAGAEPVLGRYERALTALLDYVGDRQDREGAEATIPPE